MAFKNRKNTIRYFIHKDLDTLLKFVPEPDFVNVGYEYYYELNFKLKRKQYTLGFDLLDEDWKRITRSEFMLWVQVH